MYVRFHVKRTFIHKLIDHVKVVFVVVVVMAYSEVTNEQSTKKKCILIIKYNEGTRKRKEYQ